MAEVVALASGCEDQDPLTGSVPPELGNLENVGCGGAELSSRVG